MSSMWGKIMIPMYRLWLHGLHGLYGPWCLLSPKGCWRGSLVIWHINLNQKSIFYAAEMIYSRFTITTTSGTIKSLFHFNGALIMTGECHVASLLDVIAFLLGDPDGGLPASRMLLWLGSADLQQGLITPRCMHTTWGLVQQRYTNQ